MSEPATAKEWVTAYLESGFLPIPGRPSSGGKSPLRAHKPKNGQLLWTRETARMRLGEFATNYVGLLLDRELFVLDFDTAAAHEDWHSCFRDAFDATVCCATRKGFHLWFRRSALTDTLDLTDGPLGFVADPNGGRGTKYPVDVKTRTGVASDVRLPDGSIQKYYTPGFLSVPPSPNKKWIRSPLTHDILVVPDAVVFRIRDEKARAYVPPTGGRQQRSVVPRALPDPTATVPPRPPSASLHASSGGASQTQKQFWRATPELFKHDLEAMMGRVKFSQFIGISEYDTLKDNMIERGYCGGVFWFRIPLGIPCFMCGKPAGHKNSFWICFKKDGSRRISNYNPACIPTNFDVHTKIAVTIPFTKTGARIVRDAFFKYCVHKPSQQFVTMLGAEFMCLKHYTFGCFYNKLHLVLYTAIPEADFAYAVIAFGLDDMDKGLPICCFTNAPWCLPAPADATSRFQLGLSPAVLYDELSKASGVSFTGRIFDQVMLDAGVVS